MIERIKNYKELFRKCVSRIPTMHRTTVVRKKKKKKEKKKGWPEEKEKQKNDKGTVIVGNSITRCITTIISNRQHAHRDSYPVLRHSKNVCVFRSLGVIVDAKLFLPMPRTETRKKKGEAMEKCLTFYRHDIYERQTKNVSLRQRLLSSVTFYPDDYIYPRDRVSTV